MVNNWAQFLEPLKASKLSLLIVAGAAMFLVIGGLAGLRGGSLWSTQKDSLYI